MTDPLALWVVFASCVTAVCAITFLFTNINIITLGVKMGAIQDAVDAVQLQLVKVGGEVVASRDALTAEIQALKDQLANIPGAEAVDLTGLQAVAQSLDDLNPDPV